MDKTINNNSMREIISQKIWIDNIESLFSSTNLLPSYKNTNEENYNNVSRFLIVMFLIFFVISPTKGITKDKRNKNTIILLSIFIFSIVLLTIFYFQLTKKEYFKELNYLSNINNNNLIKEKMDTPPVYKYPLLKNSKAMEKLSPTPIIYPRSHDREIWSFPSYKHSAVNDNSMGFNLTDEYEPLNYTDGFDARVDSYRDDFGLLNLNQYCNKQNGNLSNAPGTTNIGNIENTKEKTTSISTIMNDIRDYLNSTQPQQHVNNIANWEIQVDNPEKTPISTIQERFNISNSPNKNVLNYIPLRGNDDMSERRAEITLANNESVAGFLPNEMINQAAVRDQRRLMQNAKIQNTASHMYETDPSKLPPSNLLIPKTPVSMYGPGMVNYPERTKYLQNIQPNLYSFSDTTEPINANMGISYNPDLPPRVMDQVATYGGSYPLYHRIDPQLVREGGIPKERLEEMPRRTQWSAKYNTFDAQDGSVNFEDIYDPRFTGYGDEYRSYVDVNLGNVQYYYSDIDAYRDPNFGTRSKVDFIDFVDPMGRIKPEYSRDVGLNDVKKTVHNQYDADNIYFREDLMERLMRKRNQELWQLRAAPIRKDAHSSGGLSSGFSNGSIAR
jgi:hypothetical protein